MKNVPDRLQLRVSVMLAQILVEHFQKDLGVLCISTKLSCLAHMYSAAVLWALIQHRMEAVSI